MRRCILLLALLLPAGLFSATAATPDRPLASGYTAPDAPFRAGMWWNPDLDGAGMDVHLSEDRLFLVWYTYEPDGAPVWYLAVEDFSGDSWTAPLQRFTWNAAAGRAEPETVGEVGLTFHGPYSATFDWQLGGDSGSHPVESLLVSESITRDDPTGHWFNPNEPGYGVTFNAQGSIEFTVAYLYDDEGEPRWVLGQRTGELVETHELLSFEGACPACDYDPPVPTAAGSLTRKFDSATAGTLTLDVRLAEPVTGNWQRQSVPIRLLSDRQDGRNHPAAMARFASAEALETYLKRALADPPRLVVPFDFSPAPPRASMTTLQETGVDEADSIKTDGRTLYAVDPDDNSVRVLELHPESASVTELGRLALTDPDAPPLRSLYLTEPDGGAEPKLLVGLAHSRARGYFSPWHYSWGWTGQTVSVQVWNVDDPAEPVTVASFGLDGGLVESRRIGDTLYLATRFMPDPPVDLDPNPSDAEAVEANLALLGDVSLEELLPGFRMTGEPAGSLVDHANAWLPPVLLDEERPDLVTVTAIDLRAQAPAPETLTVVGPTEAIYASPQAVYLASTRSHYDRELTNTVSNYPTLTFTHVHKLATGSGAPEYRGSAAVEGHLGWLQDRKSFRMGEHRGALGVVTSSSNMWGQLGEHRLTMLRETPRTPEHRLLTEVARLPSAAEPKRLGKPGELLYATRFLGDRLYAVTFKKTDPLYVVDLSRTDEPEILGEVEVLGYSDFLHPVGENLLLGVGKDTVPADERGDGRFAWFQGLRVGLFDVSDPTQPVELESVIVGRRGTDSPGLREHHAFSFLPRGNGFPARLAIPVKQHDAWTEDDVSSSPTHFYPWVRSGLFLFRVTDGSVNPAGIAQSGAVISASRRFDDNDPNGERFDDDFARSVIMDESVFFVSRAKVWAAPWQSPNQVVGAQ